MKDKKCKIFLLIGFTVFIFSIIAMLIVVIKAYNAIIIVPPEDIRLGEAVAFGLLLFLVLFIFLPMLAEELSLIISTYKLLKHRPKGLVKMCYIIAAILPFSALVFNCLVLGGIIDFNDVVAVFLSTQWLVFILSFSLASVP